MKKRIPLTIALTASMSFGVALAQDQAADTSVISAQSGSVDLKANGNKDTTNSAKLSEGSCSAESGKCSSGSCG